MNLSRRNAVGGAVAAAIASIFTSRERAAAQYSEQEVRNGADIVSTGDVNLSQSASGSQATFGVYVDGQLVTQDGIYPTSGGGQVVVNNGRIVSTGDVNVSQSASGSQTTSTVVFPDADGEPARECNAGAVIANPRTGQVFYQKTDCCWYAACANGCQKKGCEGDFCGG